MFEDRPIIASVSGGKDSTAVMLYLREKGISFTPVFCDTGWEHPITYDYLSYLEKALDINIVRVRNEKYFDTDEKINLYEARTNARSEAWEGNMGGKLMKGAGLGL